MYSQESGINNKIEHSEISDLLRAYNSNKEYLYFDISVFNAGAVIRIKCTDKVIENTKNWNGYNFLIQNDSVIKSHIKKALICQLKDFTVDKTDNQIKRINKIINS